MGTDAFGNVRLDGHAEAMRTAATPFAQGRVAYPRPHVSCALRRQRLAARDRRAPLGSPSPLGGNVELFAQVMGRNIRGRADAAKLGGWVSLTSPRKDANNGKESGIR